VTRISLKVGLAAAVALAFCAPTAAAGKEDEAEEIRLEVKRSPEAQARAAIRAGDFRVVRTVFSHIDDIGHLRYSESTPGVACDGQIGEESAREISWGKEEKRFAEAYNAALLADPRYPDRDVCVPLDSDGGDSEWPDFSKTKGRPLHPGASVNRAARAARSDLVRAQIAAGRPFDAFDRWHRRPLHWAARRGDLESLDILLAAGARTDAREPASAVLLATDADRAAAVERLLAAGASPFDCGRIDVRLSRGNSVGGGLFVCPLRQAIERGFPGPVVALVKAIVARGAYYQRRELALELYVAVKLGRTDLVRAFVEGVGPARERYLQPAILRVAAYRRDRAALHSLLSLGGGWAARTPAEERLWLAAAKASRTEPLAMLIWFGRDLNYLPAADRSRLAAALPGLTAAELRPFLAKAHEGRERAWDAILSGDLQALDSLAAAGVDFAERRGDSALSRAAGKDSATVRWMLAHGARPDTFEAREPGMSCRDVDLDDEDSRKLSRTQRDSFVALCAEQESRGPKPRPEGAFSEQALVTALRSGDPERMDLLLPGSRPEAALEALDHLASRPPIRADLLPLVTRLAALAANGDRTKLASTLSDVLEKKDMAAATAILAKYIPAGQFEVRYALDIGYGPADECRLDYFRFLGDRGVDLATWRDSDDTNLFARAAKCDSAELVAFAATVPGLGINDVSYSGDTPLESLPLDKRGGEAGKAMLALGAKTCTDLHGEDSDKCGSDAIRPDPAL